LTLSRERKKDYRNGTYFRRLLTSLGYIDVNVPRTRKSGSAADVLGRYQRRTDEVDDAIAAMYVQNVSALVADGVGADGKRQLLGITIGAQGSNLRSVPVRRSRCPYSLRADSSPRSRRCPCTRRSSRHPYTRPCSRPCRRT
jgi:transposase-like protein